MAGEMKHGKSPNVNRKHHYNYHEREFEWTFHKDEVIRCETDIERWVNAVNDEIISKIDRGLCVLVGINKTDTIKDLEYIVRKILSIRIFDDENKRWHKTVLEKQLEVLCVSQFTLYNTWKGNRPDFHLAMPGDQSKEMYENFLQMLKNEYNPDKIKDGKFGAYMQVHIQNDGPVTFELESPEHLKDSRQKKIDKKIINSDVPNHKIENDICDK